MDVQGSPLVESFETNFRRNHDLGPYFRAAVGVGYLSSEVDPPAQGASEDEDAGARVLYHLVLGGYPSEQVVLGIHQWGGLGAARGFVSAGPGASFYFDEEENLFMSFALGVQTFYDPAPDIEVFDQWGASGVLEVGTGWWVSNHWSMGLSFLGGAGTFDLDGDGVRGSSWNVGLAVTLAVN